MVKVGVEVEVEADVDKAIHVLIWIVVGLSGAVWAQTDGLLP